MMPVQGKSCTHLIIRPKSPWMMIGGTTAACTLYACGLIDAARGSCALSGHSGLCVYFCSGFCSGFGEVRRASEVFRYAGQGSSCRTCICTQQCVNLVAEIAVTTASSVRVRNVDARGGSALHSRRHGYTVILVARGEPAKLMFAMTQLWRSTALALSTTIKQMQQQQQQQQQLFFQQLLGVLGCRCSHTAHKTH